MHLRTSCFSLLSALLCTTLSAAEPAQKSSDVSQAIDREIHKRLERAGVKPSPRADDAEFLRRVTLDITGRIPTPQHAAEFLASTEPQKRERLIDELLASSLYGEHF